MENNTANVSMSIDKIPGKHTIRIEITQASEEDLQKVTNLVLAKILNEAEYIVVVEGG